MSGARPGSPGFWRVVYLLLAASRRRAIGRQKRARQMFRQQSGGKTANWSRLGVLLTVAMMAGVNVGGAYLVRGAVTAGQRVAAEQRGQVVVGAPFSQQVQEAQFWATDQKSPWAEIDQAMRPHYRAEAERLANDYGGSQDAIAARLRATVLDHQVGNFTTRDRAAPGLAGLGASRGFPAMLGSIALLWWGLMLVMQGEGPELDTQRRRHPIWEWLLSHPIRPGAMFCAEMLAPVAASPLFWSAPLVPGFLYGFIYGSRLGILAAAVIGIPITVAAACLGKAFEIGALLRLAPRSRGAVFGLLGWFGYTLTTLLFFAVFMIEQLATAAAGPLRPLAGLPWPLLGLVLGQADDGTFSFAAGMLACWLLSGCVIAASVGFSIWSAKRGLSAPADSLAWAPRRVRGTRARFGRDPLYRKELLWFARDRSAVVQVLLVPLTMAGSQMFNLRGVIAGSQGAWNYLCGAAIIFGTYFITVLGPKSLASEGPALWIALTWPRGLESLLKAKARLWTLISSCIVGLILCYAAYRFPADIWSVALVGGGWVLFARSMADKAVTLAAVTGPSGEAETIPAGRRRAIYLGTLTFAIGVLTLQWSVAVTGIVYSMMAAAAMWQNFRAHLPYLYDPWSERLPTPPTLMHAMIAISLLVEGGAVVSVIAQTLASHDVAAVARALAYGASAFCVSVGAAHFLANRGVRAADVWRWRSADPGTALSKWRLDAPGRRRLLASLLIGCLLGLALGLLGRGYLMLLHQFGWMAEMLDRANAQMDSVPHLRASYFVMAVLIAPIAEEYLFRGLLYRALDREWHGWRAVAGSAAFFAIYHPFLSWLPVGLVGVANAAVFKKTGRLAPAVLLHMVYNAVVLG